GRDGASRGARPHPGSPTAGRFRPQRRIAYSDAQRGVGEKRRDEGDLESVRGSSPSKSRGDSAGPSPDAETLDRQTGEVSIGSRTTPARVRECPRTGPARNRIA